MASGEQRKKRKKSLTGNCFYCKRPFDPEYFELPEKGSPNSKKSRRRIVRTLEHLEPLSKGGTNAPENCTLAHAHCNVLAADLSKEEKMKLEGTFPSPVPVKVLTQGAAA
jgi:5-methylcytosine-specific restriction endonuclease McrA